MERSDNGMRAVADEIADDIWTLVDRIRAEAGGPMTRQDELRILAIRRKLMRHLGSGGDHRGRGEGVAPRELSDPEDAWAGRRDGMRLHYGQGAGAESQRT